jgi:hypothetical protein
MRSVNRSHWPTENAPGMVVQHVHRGEAATGRVSRAIARRRFSRAASSTASIANSVSSVRQRAAIGVHSHAPR